ncbi:helix-turn-helix domain-containing protein [Legionella bozemanae]|uniref:Divergent AAA domain protein n=1 Tax=Legionella bozemanae TaxID=447 RepID=A0A0W0RQR3_LEGBO|nr:ATP-binding protein [Legionella bozemanae]KTC73377.1 Divergent AAA domain protein [Legionella bozemanae]STO35605.1 Divergent AAA domain [Legionella bozemanae]
MFKHSIHTIEILEEIEQLEQNNVIENRQLEYKRELPLDKEQIITAFLKPLCAFANSNDGYIIYGIQENNQTIQLVGIPLDDPDKTKLRLESLIRGRTEPQITGTDIAVHKLEKNDNYVVIIKVKKSWYGPHRETKTNCFYGRNSAESYPMDITEIRNFFNLSSNLVDKIREFVAKRLIEIEARNTIVPMEVGANLVLHIIPLSAYTNGHQNSIAELNQAANLLRPNKFKYTAWQPRIVLEGLIGTSPRHCTQMTDMIFYFVME